MPAQNYNAVSRMNVFGHYGVAQASGIIAATLSAASVLASFRWAPTNTNLYCTILRIKIGFGFHTAPTAADDLAFTGTIARGFTTDYSANNTQANLSSGLNTGTVRSNIMNKSQMLTKGPQICTTAGMTGATSTLDNDFMHFTAFTLPGNTVSLGGTAILYDRSAEGQHPIEFDGNGNIGYVIRNVHGGPSAGTFYFYAEWSWVEGEIPAP